MKIVGAVLQTGQTFIKVKEVGAKENVLVYGRGNSHLTVGETYQFTHLMDGDRPFKSYKITAQSQVTQLGKQDSPSDVSGQGSMKDKCNDKLISGSKSKDYVEDTEKNVLRPQFQFSTDQANVIKRLNSVQPKLKPQSKTIVHTQVIQLGLSRQESKSDASRQGSVKDECNVKPTLGSKSLDEVEDVEKNVLRPQSQFSTAQDKVMKRLNSGQTKTSKEPRPKGKTYRKTKYDPKEVSMKDPKTKKKLEDWHRRDTKSGGHSWSGRVRLDPSRIRLGSDRFSRPRSDRIYNVEDSDEEEG